MTVIIDTDFKWHCKEMLYLVQTHEYFTSTQTDAFDLYQSYTYNIQNEREWKIQNRHEKLKTIVSFDKQLGGS